jgi:4-hydroxy-tetrahydrodipicolinate synthase
MSVRGLVHLQAGKGGDGTVGGGSLWGRADAQFWEDVWAGDWDAARVHAQRTDELFPKLWLPGGWAGQHGHYASELKAAMAVLGQPGGTTRRPRLPITDEAKLAEIREILEQAGVPKVGVEA